MSTELKQLGAGETRLAIQARIEGLAIQQMVTVERLRLLSIPEPLIAAALSAEPNSSEYEAAEDAIIVHVCSNRGVNEDEAISILNGHK